MIPFLALLQAQTAELPKYAVSNIFRPMATPASAEKSIGLFVFAITGVIFVIVGSLILYTILKFRRRANQDTREEPPQVYGSNQIEVAWTVIPILIVFILIGVTARVIASVQNASPPKQMLKVRIVGHQWWWQVEYPDYGIISANEVHVPVSPNGEGATYLQLESMDVNHSFWVPQLAGKTDLIPNRINYMWIDPQKPGIYLGNCAEYCGTQHANMLLRVIAQPKADFDTWASNQKLNAEAARANATLVGKGRETYESLACVNCHVVRGTVSNGKFGPDLTHVMSRTTLAAGRIENTPKNLRAWINDPQEIKPGALMPSMKLNNQELDEVVAYLESLK